MSERADRTGATRAGAGWFGRVILQRESLPTEVQAILDAEVRAMSRGAHVVRFWLGMAGLVALLANWSSNTPETMMLGGITALLYSLYAGGVWLAARHGLHRDWIKYVSITVDTTGVTALSLTGMYNYSGGYEVLLAPAFLLLYVIFNTLTTLQYSVAASLYAALLSALQRSAVLAYVLASGTVKVSESAVYGQAAVSISDQVSIIFFIAISGVIPAWRSYSSRQLLLGGAQATVAEADLERKQASLRKYVSDNVVDYMMANPEAMGLGGRKQYATVMFVDIRNFTPFTERESPERVVAFLNRFFTALVDIVFQHGGTLDKFTGDGLMAMFGVPQEMPDAPGEAVTAALEMLKWVRGYNDQRTDAEFELRIGIGIAHGLVIAGNIGSPRRMDYSVVGDTANYAARLQELNKDLATEILVSESVHDAVRGRFPVKRMPSVRVRGKRGEVAIWAIESAANAGQSPEPELATAPPSFPNAEIIVGGKLRDVE